MEKFPMCRICLVKNVPMYALVNKNLHELYEKMTDIAFVTEDSRPILICFFCCAKLKQCFKLLKKCLEAEELFAQMMDENYKPKTSVNHDHIESFSGFIKTPIEVISIFDKPEKETSAIKEELSAVCEDIIEHKEENQSDGLEPENVDNSCLEVEYILPHRSESHSEGDVPLMRFKMEVEKKLEVSKIKRRAAETNLELENIYNTYLDVEDIPPPHSESDSEGDVPLMTFKTEMEEELEVSKNKRIAVESSSASVAKKPKLDTRRPELEDTITVESKLNEHSNLKVIRATQSCTAKRVYKCDACQRNFSRRDHLTSHYRKHTGDKPYNCDVCQRSFSVKGRLISHVRIHTGEKPFRCNICQRGFREKGSLTTHVRIHTGEKPYKCDICPRSFIQKSDLTRHTRTHTGEKPYKCHICQRSFSETSHLTKHIRLHTGEKPHKCDICQHSFIQKIDLTRHVLTHTGVKPYKCDICQQSFSRKNALANHLNTHTGEVP